MTSARFDGSGLRRALPAPALLTATLLTLAPGPDPSPARAQTHDIVLLGGRVMDPESGLDAVRNVAILGSEIVLVTEDPVTGRVEIDASGLVVAPGFIDLHAHGQSNRANEFQARDGVTTALETESGVADVKAYLEARGEGARLNFGATVSHMSNRVWAMPQRAQALGQGGSVSGQDPAAAVRRLESAASSARYDSVEVARYPALLDALARGLHQGALGIGMAHQYYPGATLREILEVFRFAADHETTIYTHVRDMSMDAMQEVIANAAVTGASLHIVHVNSSSLWQIRSVLDLIGGIRARGFDVTTETYPYTAASTSIQSTIFDHGWRQRLRIDYRLLQWQDGGERLSEETFQEYRAQGGTVIIHMMEDEWVREALTRDFVMVASDGMPYAPGAHPRSAGTFSRFLGRYARDQELMGLMEALSRITIMPAQRLETVTPQARRMGRLQPGMAADITVFDPERILDTATFEDDLSHSVGVVHVLVNGQFVVRGEEIVEDVLPGRAIVGGGGAPDPGAGGGNAPGDPPQTATPDLTQGVGSG